MSDQLQHKISVQTSQLISSEDLSDRLAELKSEVTRTVQTETHKAEDQYKQMFVSSEKLTNDLQKLKREVSK